MKQDNFPIDEVDAQTLYTTIRYLHERKQFGTLAVAKHMIDVGPDDSPLVYEMAAIIRALSKTVHTGLITWGNDYNTDVLIGGLIVLEHKLRGKWEDHQGEDTSSRTEQ